MHKLGRAERLAALRKRRRKGYVLARLRHDIHPADPAVVQLFKIVNEWAANRRWHASISREAWANLIPVSDNIRTPGLGRVFSHPHAKPATTQVAKA